jgi:hypothetical protein
MSKRPKSPARVAFETCRALAADPEALRAYMALLPPSVVHHIQLEVPSADGVWQRMRTGVEDGENLFIHWFENGCPLAKYGFTHPAGTYNFGAGAWPTPKQLRGVLDERGYYQVPNGALPAVKRRRAGV